MLVHHWSLSFCYSCLPFSSWFLSTSQKRIPLGQSYNSLLLSTVGKKRLTFAFSWSSHDVQHWSCQNNRPHSLLQSKGAEVSCFTRFLCFHWAVLSCRSMDVFFWSLLSELLRGYRDSKFGVNSSLAKSMVRCFCRQQTMLEGKLPLSYVIF